MPFAPPLILPLPNRIYANVLPVVDNIIANTTAKEIILLLRSFITHFPSIVVFTFSFYALISDLEKSIITGKTVYEQDLFTIELTQIL